MDSASDTALVLSRLRQLRQQQQLTATQLGTALGWEAEAYAALEVGARPLEVTHLKPLAQRLGCSVDWLLGMQPEQAIQSEEGLSPEEQDELLSHNAQLQALAQEVAAQSEEIQAQNEQLHGQQQEAAQSNFLLRRLIDSLPFFFAVTDRAGIYHVVNKRFEEAFRRPVAEIEGRHYADILPPEMLAEQEPLIRRVFAGESPTFRTEEQLPNGDMVYSEGRYLPLMDADGNIWGCSVYVADLTELHRAKLEQDRLLATFRALVEALPMFIGIYSADGQLQITNQLTAATVGKTPAEIEGLRYTDYMPPERQAFKGPIYKQAKTSKEPIYFIEERTHPYTGEALKMRSGCIPVSNEAGEVTNLVVYAMDVTAETRAQQKLERANRTRDQLFSIISHDLKSPLNSLRGLLGLLQKQHMTPEEFTQHAGLLHEAVGSITHMLGNLLQWARGQLNGFVVTPEPLTAADLLKECHSLYQAAAFEKGIELKLESPAADVQLYADASHMRLMLRNLISNAIKFTPSEGQVKLWAHPKADAVYISVADTGHGLDDAAISRIRSASGLYTRPGTAGEKGTGLGLQLVQQMLAQNGGTLHIDSQPEQGSTFTLQLPLAASDS